MKIDFPVHNLFLRPCFLLLIAPNCLHESYISQQAINEAARVLENNGKAMIIGPIRATNPISRFFADMWYLFPQEDEYIAWFKSAGFVDIHIHRVTPDWYQVSTLGGRGDELFFLANIRCCFNHRLAFNLCSSITSLCLIWILYVTRALSYHYLCTLFP